jgi:hypothetical protein
LCFAGVEHPVSAGVHADPIDAQQGAVEDHERLASGDFDRLGERGCHRSEHGERLAHVPVDSRGANLESACQVGIGLALAQVGHDFPAGVPKAIPYGVYDVGADDGFVTAHRLFSFISVNWRGRPLTEYEVIIETIAATTTDTGLTVQAVLDPHEYPTGVKISKAEFDAVSITRHTFHGEWNYTIAPNHKHHPRRPTNSPLSPKAVHVSTAEQARSSRPPCAEVRDPAAGGVCQCGLKPDDGSG